MMTKKPTPARPAGVIVAVKSPRLNPLRQAAASSISEIAAAVASAGTRAVSTPAIRTGSTNSAT